MRRLRRAIGRVLAEGIPGERGGVPGPMIAAAASWAIYGAVKQWFSTENRVPAEEMADTALEIVLPILTAGGVRLRRTLELRLLLHPSRDQTAMGRSIPIMYVCPED